MDETGEVLEPNEKESSLADAILERRSYRSFEKKKVPDQLIEKVIAGALSAPSSKNAQPWKLHVVKNGERIQQVADLFDESVMSSRPVDPTTGKPLDYDPTVAESVKAMKSAPVSIFIENTSPFSNGRRQMLGSQYLREALYGREFESIGIGAAIQNMYLMCESLGLGGVFMGDFVAKEKEIKEALGIEKDFVGVFSFGYPVAEKDELWDKPSDERGKKVAYHE